MIDFFSTSSIMLYSMIYFFVSVYAMGSSKKALKVIGVWKKLDDQTKDTFGKYERRGNPNLNDRNLKNENMLRYKLMLYTTLIISLGIAILSVFQFLSTSVGDDPSNIFGGWNMITVLVLLSNIVVPESLRTGAYCDITTIQHDLTIVLDGSRQRTRHTD
tara:strand:+ start:983 stop:1462 length:480 start_codon:yes stop_codon:yes gene_type:complete